MLYVVCRVVGDWEHELTCIHLYMLCVHISNYALYV